eukprot:1380851-Alexandrium_andersonii.AAC.1
MCTAGSPANSCIMQDSAVVCRCARCLAHLGAFGEKPKAPRTARGCIQLPTVACSPCLELLCTLAAAHEAPLE